MYGDRFEFDPVFCPENEYLEDYYNLLTKYRAIIDYTDVCDVEILKLINEAAVMVENNYIKNAYMFDYFIQVDLFALNGLCLKSMLIDGNLKSVGDKQKQPIANVFFRVCLI